MTIGSIETIAATSKPTVDIPNAVESTINAMAKSLISLALKLNKFINIFLYKKRFQIIPGQKK
jgi:hypothetical protein